MYAPFVISGILDEAIANKIAITNTNRLANVLNEHLVLSNYGTGLLGIAFKWLNLINRQNSTQRFWISATYF